MPEQPHVIGIDLGGTHFQAGLVDGSGAIVHRVGGYTHAERGPREVLDAIAADVRACCEQTGVELSDVEAVGFAVPGAVDFGNGVVIDAPNLRWNNEPVRDAFSQRLDGLPVTLENDVNAAALAEARLGAGRGAADALAVWIGTGVGAGIILNGRVHHGPLGTAGELGQMLATPTPDEAERSRVEHLTSRKFVTRAILDDIERGRTSALAPVGGRVSALDIAEAYGDGDALVTEHVHRATDALGVAIANAITLMGVPLVLLGGGMAEAMPPSYADRLREVIGLAVFPRGYADRIDVRVTTLRENAGLLGAALTARDR